jgi:DNA polymerase III delta prime subunit
MIDSAEQGFFELLENWNETQSIGNEDLLAAVLPLMQQVAEMHEAGQVAPLFPLDKMKVDHGHLFFVRTDAVAPASVLAVSGRRDTQAKSGIKVVSEIRVISDDATGTQVHDAKVADDAAATPRFLTQYRSWEIEAGHHDPITDIYGLGMIIGSLATGLDFRQKDQLETFTRYRGDLAHLNNRLSPVICRAIERMTELERFNRAQDVPTLIRAFENHRMIGSVFENELTTSAAFGAQADLPKGELLKRLRARLYDMTRRNRLIYHKPVSTELNLTETSVPLVVNFQAIKSEDLFTADARAMQKLLSGKEVALRDYIRFEEMQFAPSVLSKLRSESARIAREHGAAPLRLVPVFLRWYDLKNDPHTPISSPLLLLRAELKRRKGVKDVFTLQALDTIAEINPALSFALEKLFGIKLPTTVDMAQPDALSDLYRLIETQVLSSEPGVRLEYADKPRIKVLHQKVRRRLDQFNKRRVGMVKGKRARSGLRYSYDHPGFNPLGLQLFKEYVTPAQAPNQAVMGRPLPRMFNASHMVEPAATEREATTFSAAQDTEGRFNWSFDLCSVTLANFNYRKMSLVRDYDAMLAGTLPPNAAFDLLFNDRSYDAGGIPNLPKPEHRYPVIEMDPSQEKSVLKARSGESYVIQGPPGTGKSQTITNLIADFIGQGKRVLFVCEKRAALDVVFNRLTGVGLGALCSLVHDSQQNKREFIQELDEIYTRWTQEARPKTMAMLVQERTALLRRISETLADVRVHIKAMSTAAVGTDAALYAVIDRALNAPPPDLDDNDRGALPDLAAWLEYEDAVDRALTGTKGLAGGQSLSERPERLLASALWADDDALDQVPQRAANLASRVRRLNRVEADLFGGITTAGAGFAQIRFAGRVAPMAEVGQLGLLDPDSRESRQFKGDMRQVDDKKHALAEATQKAYAWTDKLTPDETKTALRLAQEKEGKFLSFLSGPWRRLKKIIAARTRTADVAIAPTAVDLLSLLDAEHTAMEELAEIERQTAGHYGFDDFADLSAVVTERAAGRMAEGAAADPILASVVSDPAGAERQVLKLARYAPVIEGLLEDAAGLIEGLDTLALADLAPALDTLAQSGPHLRDLKFMLQPLANASASIWRCLRSFDLPTEQLHAAILSETVRRSIVQTPGLSAIDHSMLEHARSKIADSREAMHKVNANLLELRAMETFDAHISLTAEMDRNLSIEDRARKSSYAKARRALEHEFKKTRAYRSPREMLDGPAGALIPDMKPIWLMSPLSVADVLPLDSDLFDVVIFDEASQIPVEDSVPTLMRAPQIIVVGDEMQLPPSKFFGGSDAIEEFDDADEDLNFELDQDSFLTLSAERLKSTMLSWHYRSRSEELISFSNRAFYNGRLLTIPSVRNRLAQPEVHVADAGLPPLTASEVLARPISFHAINDGVYTLRRNAEEARYVAHLLRDILAQDSGKTIGIVAFSEAQQSEIETALSDLARTDKDFARQLDTEFEREKDGEFIGLFVKNLENVQGDERDIILLSICYAPPATGKMRMNFGPINKVGGEKRLNVIFSRAKENMIVVSSITSEQISNDYNAGANALKTFLRYAQLASTGDVHGAGMALKAVSGITDQSERPVTVAAEQIAAALQERGFVAVVNHGMSRFCVDVAARRADETDFQLAVLIDSKETYASHTTLEVLTERATLLENFGWQTVTVTMLEWKSDPIKIVEVLEAKLGLNLD